MNGKNENDRPIEKANNGPRTFRAWVKSLKSRKTDANVAIERAITSSSPIAAIAVPIGVGVVLATGAGIASYDALQEAVISNRPIRVLTIISTLSLTASISGFMFVIGRMWTYADTLRRLNASVAQLELRMRDVSLEIGHSRRQSQCAIGDLRVSVNELCEALEAFSDQRHHANLGKKRDVPRTWRGFTDYIGCNPRLLKEVEILPAGNGQLQLKTNDAWLDVWAERLINAKLTKLQIIVFVNRTNPIITEATGRTLLRLAKLVNALQNRVALTPETADWSKLSIHLVESVEVQRSFFIVTKKSSGRSRETVYQYSRAIQEDAEGSVTDAEAVEEIFDEGDKHKFRWAANQYIRKSQVISTAVLLRAFRDLVESRTFPVLSHSDWFARVRAVCMLATQENANYGITITSSSEFTIDNSLTLGSVLPWEEVDAPAVDTRRKREGDCK